MTVVEIQQKRFQKSVDNVVARCYNRNKLAIPLANLKGLKEKQNAIV
jgi:hypothetical protein